MLSPAEEITYSGRLHSFGLLFFTFLYKIKQKSDQVNECTVHNIEKIYSLTCCMRPEQFSKILKLPSATSKSQELQSFNNKVECVGNAFITRSVKNEHSVTIYSP